MTHGFSPNETAFEQARGISGIEIQDGYAQVHISQLREPCASERLTVFARLKEAKIAIKLLKLTPSGLSFLIAEQDSGQLSSEMATLGVKCSVKPGRSVIEVSSANMRDEHGFIARVLSAAIGSGAHLEHVGDRHNAMLIATEKVSAPKIAESIRQEFQD